MLFAMQDMNLDGFRKRNLVCLTTKGEQKLGAKGEQATAWLEDFHSKSQS